MRTSSSSSWERPGPLIARDELLKGAQQVSQTSFYSTVTVTDVECCIDPDEDAAVTVTV
jgi:hypothetical protein